MFAWQQTEPSARASEKSEARNCRAITWYIHSYIQSNPYVTDHHIDIPPHASNEGTKDWEIIMIPFWIFVFMMT